MSCLFVIGQLVNYLMVFFCLCVMGKSGTYWIQFAVCVLLESWLLISWCFMLVCYEKVGCSFDYVCYLCGMGTSDAHPI